MRHNFQSVWTMECFSKRCGPLEDTFLQLWSFFCYQPYCRSKMHQTGVRANSLTNFAPSSVQNLIEHFRNWTSSHTEVRQVSRGKVVVTGNFFVHTMLKPCLQVLYLLWAEILTYFCNVYFEFLSLVKYGRNNEFVDLRCISLTPITAVYSSQTWTCCVLAMINITWYQFLCYKWRHSLCW